MKLDVDEVLKQMLSIGKQAFGQEWDQVKAFLPGELKKFAIQLAEVAENVAAFEADPTQGYPPATGKVILKMQRNALEAVLTAVTALTLLTIQTALNSIIDLLKKTLGGLLAPLLPV